MPTTTGKLQFQDYDAALVARGFDGFQPGERSQLINLGYRYVARKFPWSWERTSQAYTLTPGTATILVGTGLPNGLDSIEGIDLTTDPYRRKLEPETEDRFKTKWLYLDLTNAQNQGQPAKYYYYLNSIYILPPPQVQMQFTVYYKQYLPDMVNVTDTPVLPQVFDEIVLDAALVRAHRRAHELTLAQDAQNRVDEGLADLLQDDIWQMEELQERTLPDNQWW